MQDKFKAAFKEEAIGLLDRLEKYFLQLEERPGDREVLDECMRVVHTIKGSAAMFGYGTVSRFSHDVESVIQRCRGGGIFINSSLIDLGLRTGDLLKKLLASEEPPPQEFTAEARDILRRYQTLFPGGGAFPEASVFQVEEKASQGGEGGPRAASAAQKSTNYHIYFKPARDIFRSGTRVLKLLDELSELGNAVFYPHVDDIPALDVIQPEDCYCSWDVLLSCSCAESDIREVFAFVLDRAELRIEALPDTALERGGTRRLGDILLERGAVSPEDLRRALGEQKKLGEVLVDRNYASEKEVESALAEQEFLNRTRSAPGLDSVRVPAEKLDSLVDLAAEFEALQSRFSLALRSAGDPRLESLSEESEKLVSQFRDEALSIRMLPIGEAFEAYRRLVRDLSLELGKEIDLRIEGGEIELDKSIVERLSGPLTHAVRNAADHGIETPAEREKAGKARRGLIVLSASLSGPDVLVSVHDDGRGLDLDAVRRRALELGIMPKGQSFSDAELYSLVFRPGFSTNHRVTALSGRGYGLDAVRREIEAIGGQTGLESRPGEGLSVIMRIPLSFSVIQGLLVRAGGECFILPFDHVEGRLESQKARGGEFEYHGGRAACLDLKQIFELGEGGPGIGEIVALKRGDCVFGLTVDEIIGEKRLLVRPLGRVFRDAEGISGAADMGAGSLALLLDINHLADLAQNTHKPSKGIY